jgi:quercetin dioxygenase-like cupin family protein
MITKRDLATAIIAASVTLACVSMADEPGKVLDSTAWLWGDLKPNKTDVGERREVVQQPTRTLDELEMHITTLNPHTASHPPHTHPKTERVTVISGTFNIGMGEKFDAKAATPMTAGTYGYWEAGMKHFVWIKGETVAQFHGIGPWSIQYVNPADDPRNQTK